MRRDLGAKPNEISWAVSVGRPQTGGPKAQSSSTSFRRKTSLYFMLEPHCLQCRTYVTVTTFQCCLVAAQSQAQRPTRYCRKLSQQTSTTPNFIPEIVFTCKATQVPTHNPDRTGATCDANIELSSHPKNDEAIRNIPPPK